MWLVLCKCPKFLQAWPFWHYCKVRVSTLCDTWHLEPPCHLHSAVPVVLCLQVELHRNAPVCPFETLRHHADHRCHQVVERSTCLGPSSPCVMYGTVILCTCLLLVCHHCRPQSSATVSELSAVLYCCILTYMTGDTEHCFNHSGFNTTAFIASFQLQCSWMLPKFTELDQVCCKWAVSTS